MVGIKGSPIFKGMIPKDHGGRNLGTLGIGRMKSEVQHPGAQEILSLCHYGSVIDNALRIYVADKARDPPIIQGNIDGFADTLVGGTE